MTELSRPRLRPSWPAAFAAALLFAAASLAADAPAQPKRFAPDASGKGRPVVITRGKIPLSEFLAFLADYTGIPVLANSSDPILRDKEIMIVHDITKADEDMVKAILEVNGVRVYKETLASGYVVLKAESMDGMPNAEDPTPRSIVRAEDGTVWRPEGAARRGAKKPPAEKGEPEADRWLRDLEAKVDRIITFLGLRERPPPASKPEAAERVALEKRERIEALKRQFEERMEALRKEHLEAVRKVLEEPPASPRIPVPESNP